MLKITRRGFLRWAVLRTRMISILGAPNAWPAVVPASLSHARLRERSKSIPRRPKPRGEPAHRGGLSVGRPRRFVMGDGRAPFFQPVRADQAFGASGADARKAVACS